MLILTEQLRKEKDDLLLQGFTAAIHGAQEHSGDDLLIGKAVQPACQTGPGHYNLHANVCSLLARPRERDTLAAIC